MTKTTPAQALATAVWNAGNRHGADKHRQDEILCLCEKAIDEAYGEGYMAGIKHEGKQ